MHNKWYSQLLFPTRSRKWIKLIFWLAITDITVYKWILKWVEWMDSRSITTCSLIVTRHLLKYSLNNATFDYSKQFERNTKKKKKRIEPITISKAPFQSPDVLAPLHRRQVFHVSSPLPLPFAVQTWKVDGPRGEKNN